ncbi:hypothetical protein [Saccharothrix hoggarensis]|uniref:Neocarzinostatin family protein n=1 Tax=Saccharothrix hoggarensis TaxID=913853 RepID=A0ABW3QIV6_9PSEU
MGRRIWVLGVLFLAAACGTNAGAPKACTLIGTMVGLTVDVDHPDVVSGSLEVCDGGSCATHELVLHESRGIVGTTCTGTSPDDTCGARSEPTGGKHAFVVIPDLPTTPVTVALKLLDQSGSALVDRGVTVTPEMAYPNGPDCPGGGPQAGISVGADGSVTAS